MRLWCLSTPSLGITNTTAGVIGLSEMANFQLPLSGSLELKEGAELRSDLRLSTPSLGITSELIRMAIDRFYREYPFNSLSRDHATLRRKSAMLSKRLAFQLSLGITEPDSGIFQLSAAFCRGTSSHR